MIPVRAGDDVPLVMEVSADQNMLGNCDRCGGDEKAMIAATCSAFGACLLGMVPAFDSSKAPSKTLSYSYSAQHFGDLRAAPDPFPPKPDILV